ncbi:MAG: tetratricopeptide repeat protein [Cellvibrionaceae bacterium]
MSFKELFDKGQEKFFDNQWSEAVSLYNDALKERPNDSDTLMNLGSAYFMLKEYEKCIAVYEEYEITAGENEDILFTKGMAHYYFKQLEDSINAFNRVMAVNPLNNKAMFQIGMSHLEMKDYEKACDCFRASMHINFMNSGVSNEYDRRTDVLCLYNLIKAATKLENWGEVQHKVELACDDFEEPELVLEVIKNINNQEQQKKLLEILVKQEPNYDEANALLKSF